MEGLADIASALQGESHTSETMKWSQELHEIEMNFTDELHKRELNAEQRRAEELRDLENKLLARKLQVELDIGRRDATRDSVLLRASSVGNLLVTLSVMIGCAFMFVYQIQLPATLPESPENYTTSSLLVQLNSSGQSISQPKFETQVNAYSEYQLAKYQEHLEYAQTYGGGQISFLLHTIFLWTAIGVLASAVWLGLVLHLRIKHFKVHLPLFVYDCGHVHGVFGSYYSCRCLFLEVAMRRLFIIGTVLIILASCVSSYEISVVSFASLGAALCFLVPVLFAILVVLFGTFFVSEETAAQSHLLMNSKRRRRNRKMKSNDYQKNNNSSGDKDKTSRQNNSSKREGSSSMVSSTTNNNNQYFHHRHGPMMEPIDGGATILGEDASPRSALPSPLVKRSRKRNRSREQLLSPKDVPVVVSSLKKEEEGEKEKDPSVISEQGSLKSC